MARQREVFSREFKLGAVSRMATTDNVSALARELGVHRNQLYYWEGLFRRQGAGALKTQGRPALPLEYAPATARPDKIAELERIIGRQQAELDFFRAALQQVRETRRRNGGPGGPASTR